jgi:polyisoprenoid-binding protein YceI
MITRLYTGLACTALLVTLAPIERSVAALEAPVVDLTLAPESRLWIEGTSTARGYTCRAGEIKGAVRTPTGRGGIALAELGDAVLGVDVEIPVARLDCGNGTMNDHMRKALLAEEHPSVRFRVTSHKVVLDGGDEGRVEMRGELTIAGTTKPIEVSATATPGEGGLVQVRGSKEIDMTEYGVKPPKLMLGAMKVHERVKVHFDMALKP